MTDVYKKNYITNVILRIDLSPILAVASEEPKAFQEAIKEKFPLLKPQQTNQVDLQTTEGNFNLSQSSFMRWIFASKDKKVICELASESLVIKTQEYKDFTSFYECAKLCIDALFASYGSSLSTRVGLRYVNEIPDDFTENINPALMCNMQFLKEEVTKGDLSRVMQQMEFNLENGSQLRLSHGVFNNNYPKKIVNQKYILDFDCFTKEEYDNANEINKILKEFNTVITESFENSITDKYRNLMNK